MSKSSAGTPLMRQYNEVKSQYPDTIILFRMGDFYETFNDDAKITSKVLGIVLTERSNGAAARVPLAGFPYHALDNYLHKLVNAGYRVAICEQVEDPKLAKGIVKREVIEVVTPGTISADQALDRKTNQFLAALTIKKNRAGFAALDQSTGEFYISECSESRLVESLRKFAPREILIMDGTVYSTSDWYRALKPFVTKIESWLFDFEQGKRLLTQHFQVKSLKGFGCDEMPLGITAAGALFYHVINALGGNMEHITTLRPVTEKGIMGLDGFTIRNLEIFKSLATQGIHGTLIDGLDETITAGGGRLLKKWLLNPLTKIDYINQRHAIVEELLSNKSILKIIRDLFKRISDIERILGKINRGKVTPKEINGLSTSLEIIPEIIHLVRDSKLEKAGRLANQFEVVNPVVEKIHLVLNPEAPHQLKQGQVINKGVNTELDELRTLSRGGKEWIVRLQKKERERTGIPSLKVGFNKVFGYYLEITRTHHEKVPEEYIRKQTLVNSERYVTPELKEYEEKILSAEAEIEVIETRIFDELTSEILSQANHLQKNAEILSQFDVLCAFAQVAQRHKYVRPTMVEEPLIKIRDGRHPVVEWLLPSTERFVPNDLTMDARSSQIHLITGPNMAGKSTYLRQTGLIVLLAQVGSFVPAMEATIGIVDKLFTRVGASDNLSGGESTFLVEMNEAANILNNATHRSLILLDEIGRGTATFDGLSLAWSITEYLHNHPEVGARTLFATHYHELTDLDHTLERLENYHIAVKEFGDKIVFLRKIKPGPGDKSYGIHVAQMAGLPREVITRAKEILNFYLTTRGSDEKQKVPEAKENQLSFFTERETALKKDLTELDVLNLTPLEAIQKLDELKKKHGL
ncbi:MAG: DNA mismatch repair protein MutS [Fidelibacterota bacterium]